MAPPENAGASRTKGGRNVPMRIEGRSPWELIWVSECAVNYTAGPTYHGRKGTYTYPVTSLYASTKRSSTLLPMAPLFAKQKGVDDHIPRVDK